MLGDNFHRLDPLLNEPIPIDNAAGLAALEEAARAADLSPTIEWIKEHVYGEKEQGPRPQDILKTPTRRTSPVSKKEISPSHKERTTTPHGGKAREEPLNVPNMHWGTDAWFSTQGMWE